VKQCEPTQLTYRLRQLKNPVTFQNSFSSLASPPIVSGSSKVVPPTAASLRYVNLVRLPRASCMPSLLAACTSSATNYCSCASGRDGHIWIDLQGYSSYRVSEAKLLKLDTDLKKDSDRQAATLSEVRCTRLLKEVLSSETSLQQSASPHMLVRLLMMATPLGGSFPMSMTSRLVKDLYDCRPCRLQHATFNLHHSQVLHPCAIGCSCLQDPWDCRELQVLQLGPGSQHGGKVL
jgi:hypothetical protein